MTTVISKAQMPGMQTCPICGAEKKDRFFKLKLYGVPVCKKCLYRFANRRQIGWFLDALLLYVMSVIFGMVIGLVFPEMFSASSTAATDAFWVVFGWVLAPFLFTFKDGFRGHSPGKWLMGVQAVGAATQEPISFGPSVKRNLVTMIPFVPLLMAFQLTKGFRWGDRWAETKVIWKKYRHEVPFDTRGILCHACGYNLTGNVSGRCPECGQDIPSVQNPTELPLEDAAA